MRKTLKDIRMLASLLLAGAALLSCSSDDETPASTPETPETPKTCTMTVQATKGADTRALSDAGTTLTSTWTVGDVVTVLSSDEATTYGTLTAQSSGESTTLYGTLTSTPSNNQQLLLKYLSASYGAQDGTLTGTDNSIDKVCDYSTATVTATVDGDHVTTTDANFANQQAIVKFTLSDGTSAINATALTVSDGTNNITLSNIPADTYDTTKGGNGDGVLYVALPGFSGQTVSLIAATSNKNYRYSKENVTFTNSNFYRIAVTMNEYVPGLLDGKFTVDDSGTKVSFSQGNLQATYNGLAWTWAFATNQWDYIGNKAGNTSINGDGTVSANNVTVDLFGWSTNATTFGIYSSTSNGDYSGDFVDWGTNIGSGWRTLTSAEWKYLLETRTVNGGTGSGKSYTLGQSVGGTPGLVIYPDGYSGSVYTTGSNWSTFEADGCVFLPAAGNRSGATVQNIGTRGFYWSSTPHTSEAGYAYRVRILPDALYSQGDGQRMYGISVRLVREVE